MAQEFPTPAFDDHHPPDPALIDDCVHCGFCLTSCPTYRLWGEEMDSPRGRIHLMKTGNEGAPLTDTMVSHFDACLGCMACVTSCPSGVQYDRLIEQTRAQVERRHARSRPEKALRASIFALFPYPARLRLMTHPLRAAQRVGADRWMARSRTLARLSPQLAAMARLAPQIQRSDPVPQRVPATGGTRAVVGMLTGCVQREFFPGVNAATARVLSAEGFDVVSPSSQGCCGALSTHAGREPEGQRFARDLIDTFEEAGVEYVVANSAGCGSAMKDYVYLLADDAAYADRARAFSARVRDAAEILAEFGTVAPRRPVPPRTLESDAVSGDAALAPLVVAYHDACHLRHAQGIRDQPRQLLREIPNVELREIADAEICCGSAGIYNILNPQPAAELGDAKAASVLATGASVLVTANPGCLLQIAAALARAGTPLQLAHTMVLLDASIRGVPLP